MECVTTYEYEPLEGERFIRLLKIRGFNASPSPGKPRTDLPAIDDFLLPEFDIIHASLDDEDILYETLSYAWGDSTRVGELPIAETGTHIALTQSLVNALPHLVRHSRTGMLWIDQLCINQRNDPEREQQVSVMGDVFRTSSMTFVWLGLDDVSGRLVVEWIEHIAKHDIKHPIDSMGYRNEVEKLWIKHEAHIPTREHVSAVVSAKNSAWCSRGWIIQEFVLSRAVEFLWGDRAISASDMSTLECACSPSLESTYGSDESMNLTVLESTKGELAVNQDLEYSQLLYIISRLSGLFETTLEHDGLFAYLGLWKPPSFLPSYNEPLKNVFIKFAHSLAKDTGSLDFLPIRKLCRSNRPGLASLPSWVPIWSEAGISLLRDMIFPWNLKGTETPWNAAAGLCPESADRSASDLLSVKGRAIDHISFTSQFVMSWKYFPDQRSLYSELEKLTREIATWREAQSWKMVDTLELLLRFSQRREDYERSASQTLNDLEEGRANALRIVSATMGGLSGRTFMMTRGDRLGLIPSYCMEGHSIAIIHGCRVPLVLFENVEDGTYKVMGDCYLGGAMHGEAVTWKKEDADELILS